MNQKLLRPSEDISHHILPFHCPGLPSRQPYTFGASTHSHSSQALSLSILHLWDRPSAGGRTVRHGDPCAHCRILPWIPHREQLSVPTSPGCHCHLQPCPASWPRSMGTAGPSPCSEVWNRVSGMFVSLPATFAIFRELFGVGERSSALQSSTRSNQSL